MITILLLSPYKKNKIYLQSPTYFRIYDYCKFLSNNYPNFELVDDPKKANIEIIIYPNNPDGKLSSPKTLKNKIKSLIIFFSIYLYLYFFINKSKYNEAIQKMKKNINTVIKNNNIFFVIKNLSQMFGSQGYRISWCYVSNLNFISKYNNQIISSNGISSITVNLFNNQLKNINLNYVFELYSNFIRKRIKQIKIIFDKIEKKYNTIKIISFLPFIFIHDNKYLLYKFLKKNNIIVPLGNIFNTNKNYIRINIFLLDDDYKYLINILNKFILN